ncbi:hypothetical protein Lal_00004433 [Lupinus albus]|nr:hypothetical protein Lal_00004433 [Lupinus albus]
MTTNLAECVNGVLKGSRALPITSLVQATYHRLNSWFLHHRNEATSMIMAGHIYCEELTKVLNENNHKATCQTIRTFSRESRVFVVEVPGGEGSRHSKTNCWTTHSNELGAVPNERQIVGQRIQMSWLDSTFQQLPDDATEIVIDQHARAFILRMIGGFLMPDTSGSRVHLMYLLMLEDLSETYQYSWESAIPDMARSRVPLICFAIVEWHAADRVMRQFGLQQPIPQDPINLQKQHKMDLRGKNDYNWQQKHDQWIQIWNHREDYVMNGLPNVQPLYHYSEYMQWYLQRTRKYISPDGAYSSGSYNFIRSIRDQCAPSTVHDNPMQFIHGVYLQCNEMIDAFAKLLPTAFSDSNYQAPLTMPVAPEFQQPFESQTQTDTHPQAFTQQTPVPQQPFQFQSSGALSDYSISHQFGSSSHYEESLPTMFGTTSTTPLSAFNSEQYY